MPPSQSASRASRTHNIDRGLHYCTTATTNCWPVIVFTSVKCICTAQIAPNFIGPLVSFVYERDQKLEYGQSK